MNSDEIHALAEMARCIVIEVFGEVAGHCENVVCEMLVALRGCDAKADGAIGLFRVDRLLPEEMQLVSHQQHRAQHVWLEVDDQIVDPSADQFNGFLCNPMPTVVVGSYEQLQRYEKKDRWPHVESGWQANIAAGMTLRGSDS